MAPLVQERIGAALAVGAAAAFGVTIVANRSLAGSGVGVVTALGVRFAAAAAVLFALLAARGGSLLPAPGERVPTFLLGAVGYSFEAMLFYLALERGTAAAVALLFYTYPAMVAAWELASGSARTHARTIGALVLSAAGTAVVVVGGGRVAIAPAGVLLSLASAASFAVYLVASSRLAPRTGALTLGAWVAAGAAAAFLAAAGLTGGLDPAGHWPVLAGNGAATAAAFGLLFAALDRLGPTRTSVVMTLEAFFGTVLAAAVLGEGLRPLQAAGGAAVLTAAAVVALTRGAPSPAGPRLGRAPPTDR